MNKVLSDKKAIALMILPPFLIYFFLMFVPIVWSFVYSLYSGTPGLKFEFVGLSNYKTMFFDKSFQQAFSVNMRYVAIVTISQVSLGLLVSLVIHFGIKHFKTIVRTIVFFPTILPVVAVAQMFSKMYEITPQYGLVNSLLELAGLEQFIQPWLGQKSTAFAALCIMDIWTAIGFYTVIIYGSLVDIPGDMIEAAKIDGASGIKMFRYIILPQLRTILITCFVFSFSGTIKLFESATALTGGNPGASTKSLSMLMYENAFSNQQYGYGSAIAIFILFLCVFVASLVNIIGKEREPKVLRVKGGARV